MIEGLLAAWIDGWPVLTILVGAGLTYCALHRWAERARAAVLARREVWPMEKVMAGFPRGQELDSRLRDAVLSGVATALGVQPGQLRIDDRLDDEYRLRYSWLLLDETDETLRDAVRKQLARVGLPGWRSGTWVNSVGELILQVQEFAAQESKRRRS